MFDQNLIYLFFRLDEIGGSDHKNHKAKQYIRYTVYLGSFTANWVIIYYQNHLLPEPEKWIEPWKEPSCFPLFWLFNRDPYNGLLYLL